MAGGDDAATSHTWEDIGGKNTWETAVQEDAEGRIILAGGESTAEMIRRRRKRLEQNDYSQRNRRVVRDMIRYVYVLIDCSRWVRDKDPVLPGGTKIDVAVAALTDFVSEYYDQNPLSHLGFVILKNGEAEMLTRLSSSSKTHKLALQSVSELAISEGPTGGGEFSLQNGLEVAGRSLGHQPRHGSREIVIVCGALSTCDPANVLTETLPRLKAANIRVSTLALSAEMHVCRKIADETGGSMGVCLDKAHLRDWLMGQCIPPPATRQQKQDDFACEMVEMGFPSRTKADIPTLVHATRDTKLLARTAYTCPQCHAKVSELPTDCVVCGLKLVLSPHLARSFHHLFPVAPFTEVPIISSDESNVISSNSSSSLAPAVISSSSKKNATKRHTLSPRLRLSDPQEVTSCFSCLKLIGVAVEGTSSTENDESDQILRFRCPECGNVFCVDCDTFLHDTLHNCPGCLLNC